MDMDFKRAFLAPFRTDDKANLLHTAITLPIILFVVFVAQFFITMVIQIFFVIDFIMIGVASSSHNEAVMIGGIIGAIFLFIILSIFFILMFFLGFAIMSFILGYFTESASLELNGNDIVLPQLKGNIGHFFYKGLKLLLALLVYTIGAIIIDLIPILIVAILIIAGIQFFGEDSMFIQISSFIGIVIVFLIHFAIMLSLLLLTPLIIIHYSVTNTFSSALELGAMLKNFSYSIPEYLLVSALTIMLSFVLIIPYYILLLTCIGAFFIPFLYISFGLIVINLFAQAYKRSLIKMNKAEI